MEILLFKQCPNTNISVEEFKDYFSNMFQCLGSVRNQEAEFFNASHDFDLLDPVYADLDRPISYEEVINCIKSLKRNKASANDRLLNEYFIESFDILAGHISEIFYIILNTGCFPEPWAKGIIVPIH